MNDQRFGRQKLAIVLFAILVAGAVAVVAYNAGVAHGLALNAAVEQGGGMAAAYHHPYGHYGWHPWGFGVGFPLFPLFALFFFVFVFRFLVWGGPWRRHWHGGGPDDLPGRFDDWHRRAHERMSAEPPAPKA